MADKHLNSTTTAALSQWRAGGEYATTSIATAGLLTETLIYLRVYSTTSGSVYERTAETKRRLIEGALPQRSRATRLTFAKRLSERLASWNPPAWLLDELVSYYAEDRPEMLKAMLLVIVCRQDFLLYSLVQQVVFPRWQTGERQLLVADVHRFFDEQIPTHPEIERWAYATRNRLASNMLSTLRDYGLLRGVNQKEIVEPMIPDAAAVQLARLLAAEGLAPAEIAYHADWGLWLWTPERAASALAAANAMKEG